MGRRKTGGYIFEWYKGDHRPLHIHVFKNGAHLGRYDLESGKPMRGLKMTSNLDYALIQAGFKKGKRKP